MSPINGDNKKIGPAIGIDLGTWKCCVGVLRDGKVEIIENERGSKTTPSYVAFTETERIIGEDAKSQVALDPTNTVYGVKRIIGRRFDDPSLQDIKDTFPFKVKEYDGKPFIEIIYKGKTELLCPEQVTAMLLTKMKRIAESHLGCEVKNAVISVPAYFNNAQRQATKDAGGIAGLNVLGLINEPTAAALAYRDNNGPTDETICIVDLGGGTVDVSVIRVEGERGITVMETHGNSSIGGMDFDQRLVTHFREEFLTTSNHNISGNSKALERLRLACEKLKHTLLLLPTTRIQIDCLAADTDLESSITRDTFEKLCHKDFTESLHSVLTKVLHRFDRIVLVGGSSRIPYIQEMLKNVLDKSLDKSVNPDEAVAHGAAIKAALLGHEASVQDVAVRDVTTHTFVIEHQEGREVVFQQNSHERRKTFSFESKNSLNDLHYLSECLIDIRTNTLISRRHVGSIKLSNWTEGAHSQLNFTINNNGIFCGDILIKEGHYPLPFDSDHLNTEHIAAMEKQEKHFVAEEVYEKSRLISLSDLEAYCFNKKSLIEELSADDCAIEKKQKFICLCRDTIDWLDDTPEATQDMCETKKKELLDFFNILVPPSLKAKETNMNTNQPPKRTSLGGENLADGPHKKKKLDDQKKFAAQTSSTICQDTNVPLQEPVTRPYKSINDKGLNYGMQVSENDFAVQPGSSEDPRARQATGLPAGVHKPGLPTTSGAISANSGHHGGYNQESETNMNTNQPPKRTSQGREILADGLHKKKNLDDQMKFAAQTSSTVCQDTNVPLQEPVTRPCKFDNDKGLNFGMQVSENDSAVQPGSSEDPRDRQATGHLPGVHKPGPPTTSDAISANRRHHSRYGQASRRHQQTASKHYHPKLSRNTRKGCCSIL